MEKSIMQKKIPDEELEKDVPEEREEVKFGYGASIVFVIFIVFVVYYSLTR